MSEHDSHEHTSFIKTPTQLIVVIVLSFVIPVLLIAMLASIASKGVEPSAANASDEAIAKRLKPVGEVVVAAASDPSAPIPGIPAVGATQAPVPAPTTVPAGATDTPTAGIAAAGKGKAVYDSSCVACHGAGLAGAPKAGDKAGWAPRLGQGVDALHQAALKGKGAMPPKGGNMALADADVKAAVDFMVSQVK